MTAIQEPVSPADDTFEQPYDYARAELVEPDWRRFPGWREVTEAQEQVRGQGDALHEEHRERGGEDDEGPAGVPAVPPRPPHDPLGAAATVEPDEP